jgi:hypothetical protein
MTATLACASGWYESRFSEAAMIARLGFAAGLLIGVGLLLAADGKDATVPDSVYPGLQDSSVKIIREALKGEVRGRAATRAATAAVMLAAFAQQNLAGADGGKRATIRDTALEIAALIRKKDHAAALKQLDTLPTLAADPKVKKEPIKLEAKIDYKDVMTQFRAPSAGGLGIEDRLDTLGRNVDDTVPAKDLTEVVLHDAYRSAVAAELLHGHQPKEDAKEWHKLADAMRRQSLDLATAVKVKDGKAAYQAVQQLNRTCDKCHQQFRKD